VKHVIVDVNIVGRADCVLLLGFLFYCCYSGVALIYSSYSLTGNGTL